MRIPHLISRSGAPFKVDELDAIRNRLQALGTTHEREQYRNENSSAISEDDSPRILIVSGPGTGKSYLFRERVKHWAKRMPGEEILVTSFVNKLVDDLRADLQLVFGDEGPGNIVTTLHSFARSVLERNHGTSELRFSPHIDVIDQPWKERVWNDALYLLPDVDTDHYQWSSYENQLHTLSFVKNPFWLQVRRKYHEILRFYNAVGFGEMIVFATDAVRNSPALVPQTLFIVDEYQDFNAAEDALLSVVTSGAKGLLVAGDDDQVLYDKLKSGTAELIRGLYSSPRYTKGMLPLCGRSSYHICLAARHFATNRLGTDSIDKVIEPIDVEDRGKPVRAVACAHPSSAVEYILTFIDSHEAEIADRQSRVEVDPGSDPFLLILSPEREANFLRSRGADSQVKRLLAILAKYRPTKRDNTGFDLDYLDVADDRYRNFSLRKVLSHQGVGDEQARALVAEAIGKGVALCDLEAAPIVSALSACERRQMAAMKELEGRFEEYFKDLVERRDEALEAEYSWPGSAMDMLTFQSAKGLSADHVIIIGFDNMNMRFVSPTAFYVALTRARKSLHIITALQAKGASGPNPFLQDLPDSNLEFVVFKKSDGKVEDLRSRQRFMDRIDWWRRKFSRR